MSNILPVELKKEYDSIKLEFGKISGDWEKYEDNIIPEDPVFARRILKFMISVVDYGLRNFNSIDLAEFKSFLYTYPMEFYYGPSGDDFNYLDFDERFEGDRVSNIFYFPEEELFMNDLEELKFKLSKILDMFDNQ